MACIRLLFLISSTIPQRIYQKEGGFISKTAEAYFNAGETEISDADIIEVIADYGAASREIRQKLEILRDEYRELDENIYEYMAREAPHWETKRRGTSPDGKMIHMVADKQRELSRYRLTLQQSIRELEEDLGKRRQIHLAYIMLPRPQYQVLKKLYEEHLPWKCLPAELGIPKSSILRLRTQALETIRWRVRESRRISPGTGNDNEGDPS